MSRTTSSDHGANPVRRWRLGLLLWLGGLPGIVLVTTTMLPQLLARVSLPAPLPLVMLASLAQSALLLALAVWAGTSLAPALGLRAPVFEALAAARAPFAALRPQLWPGVLAGVSGGLFLYFIARQAPAALLNAQASFEAPLLARILYGGITEELLLRWGLMTMLGWLGWRLLPRRTDGRPTPAVVATAISLSALLFGAGHLPAASALLGGLDPATVTYVLGANTLFGVLFGYLYWKWGLEAAMLAHALAHIVNAAVATLLG